MIAWLAVRREVSFEKTFYPVYQKVKVDRLIIMSKSAPYSYLEKALMPFDPDVWYWLIGFLVFGVLVIVAVSFFSQKVQNFVFGLRIRAPMLNMM
jgi:hypothetical protein